MGNRRYILLVLAALLTLPSFGLDLKVRLFSDQKVQRFMVSPDSSDFLILALNKKGEVLDTIFDIYQDNPQRSFVLNANKGRIELKAGDQSLGLYHGIYFEGLDSLHQFRISANKKNRSYFGGILAKAQKGEVLIINKVDIEHYVAGVVESEAGHVSELEFYKAQAILARTFALRNINKHVAQGYNLKDDVTSQVYFSKAHYTNKDLIIEAVEATRDTVLVDNACKPILSVFHANSGGQTVNSEDVWLTAVPQLRAREDSFSVGVGSYEWEKTVDADRFFSYFAKMFGVKNDQELQKALLNFEQSERQKYFSYQGKRLKLTKVRQDFRLRSTNFTVDLEGESVILRGNGFGHGVGLSQDGAIEMSSRGFSYQSILFHYYDQIELEAITQLDEVLVKKS